MKSIPEMDYWWCCGPWFEERIDAARDGYIHNFTPDSSNQYSLSDPDETFQKEDLIITEKVFPDKYLTLVLIETKCGRLKGTAIKYHKRY